MKSMGKKAVSLFSGHLHWLTLTVNVGCDFLHNAIYDCFHFDRDVLKFEQRGRTAFFGKLFVNPIGLSVACEPIQPNSFGDYCTLSFPGKACDALSLTVDTISRLVSLLGSAHWNCTRLDWAVDHAPFSPRDFYDAAYGFQRGEMVTRMRQADKQFIVGGETGDTCYFGNRKSSGQLCVYNMRGFTRVEFRLRHERADSVLRYVLAYDGSVSRFMSGQVADAINFPSWSEWVAFVGSPSEHVRVPNKPGPTTAKSLAWFAASVAPTVASLIRLGHLDVLNEQVRLAGMFPSGSQFFKHQVRRFEKGDCNEY